MLNRGPLDRATACCLSIACRYRTIEPSAWARDQMAAEVELLFAYLLELDLPPGATAVGVLVPVEDHLLARFGAEEGRRLVDEFEEAFEAASRNLLNPGGPVDRRGGPIGIRVAS